mmetsp:Transcript_14846/g.42234  ORF Transcript_14846/g.42234 Transcript_14846/m.42234 type:complete len:246 (+) Transcript_14846:1691-2428(+)
MAVTGTRAKPSRSRRNAATSRSPASPTRTVGFRPGSPKALPTNPLGLFGASGSSSKGLITATGSPWSPLNTYEPPSPSPRALGRVPTSSPLRTRRTSLRALSEPAAPPRRSTVAVPRRRASRPPSLIPWRASASPVGGTRASAMVVEHDRARLASGREDPKPPSPGPLRAGGPLSSCRPVRPSASSRLVSRLMPSPAKSLPRSGHDRVRSGTTGVRSSSGRPEGRSRTPGPLAGEAPPRKSSRPP